MESSVTFRRATEVDALRFYAARPRLSLRGWVAEKEGAIVAIGGVYYEGGAPIAFSEITDDFRKDRRDVAKGCRILMQMISKIRGPVFAVADPEEPTAGYLLVKLGWKPTGRFTALGELMVRG